MFILSSQPCAEVVKDGDHFATSTTITTLIGKLATCISQQAEKGCTLNVCATKVGNKVDTEKGVLKITDIQQTLEGISDCVVEDSLITKLHNLMTTEERKYSRKAINIISA